VAPGPPRKTERRTLFDEPELFSDKSQRNGDSTRTQKVKPYAWPSYDPTRNAEQDRALSPIRQYDWAPESSEKSVKDNTDQSHRFESGLFSRSRDDERNPRRDALTGFFEAPAKRELSREDLAGKAEFEKLLNPGLPAMIGRNGPLGAPATPFGTARPPAPLIPMVDTPARTSLDPMQSYNDQQRRWAGPSMDDLNRKAFGTPAPKPARSTETADQRPPLMRQPTFQDFPGRRF